MAETKPLIKESLFLLNGFGINLKNQTLWGYARVTITMLIIGALTFEMMLACVLKWSGADSMYNVSNVFIVYMVEAMLYTLILNRRKLIVLLEIIGKFWQVTDPSEEIKAIYHSIRRLYIVASGIAGVIIVSFVAFSVIFRRVPLETYHPIDRQKSPNYEFVVFFVLSFMGTSGWGYFAFFYLFLSFVIYAWCEFKMINDRILALPHKALDGKELQQEFAVIIDQHNLMLKFMDAMNDFYSIFVLNLFFSVIFLTSVSLSGVVIKGFGDMSNFLRLSVLVVAALFHLLIYCVGGTILTSTYESVSNAIVESDWMLIKDQSLKRSLVVAIQRSQKAATIKALGVFDLNLESFTSVLNTALSFFSLFKATYGNIAGK